MVHVSSGFYIFNRNPDFALEIVARIKIQSRKKSWRNFDTEAYHEYVEYQNRKISPWLDDNGFNCSHAIA